MDYIIVPLLLVLGFGLKNRYKGLNSKDHILINQLFFYHIALSVVFYFYITINGGDAQHYWSFPKKHNFQFFWNIFLDNPRPSQTMWLLNFVPSNILNLNFFSGCILYGFFGHWGILYLLLTIKKLFPNYQYLKRIKVLNVSLFPLLLFMPNFHFWSAGVGKDTLSFYVVCIALYVFFDLKKRWHIFLLPALLLYFVRPHILLFIISGFAVSFLIKSKLLLIQKVILLGICIVIFLPFLNSVLEFAKIDDASFDSFTDFSSSKSSALAVAGSGVDLASLPYPLQVLTFLFRPLFFDTHNIFALFASIENVIWIFLSFKFFTNKPLTVFKKSNFLIFGGFLYWIIGALAFAPVMGNLGIIIRERNMFLPGFILFAVAGLYYSPEFQKFNVWLENHKIQWLKKKQKQKAI